MDVDNLIIDHEASYLKILDHVKTFAPQLKDRISLYSENTPIFESYNIEVEISRAIEKKGMVAFGWLHHYRKYRGFYPSLT